MKKKIIPFLLVLPVVYTYLSLVISAETGHYYMFSSDPVYAYIFDGLNLCNFKMPFLVEGPGTPLSIFYAIVMGVTHLFRPGNTLIVDVFQNTDFYLTVINASMIIFQSIALMILGYSIYKTSKNIFTGLFFQLMPFISWIFIDITRPIMVESLIVIEVFALTAQIFNYLCKEDNKTKVVDKYLIWFSVIIGILAATKLMYLPIAIIPFLLLPGYKKKVVFVIFSIIVFSCFAFPIFSRWITFRDYYIKNLIHSGQYGAGPANFADPNLFMINLKNIFDAGKLFVRITALIVLVSVVYHIPYLKLKRKADREYLFLLGCIVTILIMTILVAKQYKFYYMITALLVSIPALYISYRIICRNFPDRFKLLLGGTISLVLLYFMFADVKMRMSCHPAAMAKVERYISTKKYIESKYDNQQPTLVNYDYFGVPYEEFGMFYGMAWCRGSMHDIYATELKKLYPNIYFFHTWNKLFNHWDISYSMIDLLKKYKKMVYFTNDDEKGKLIEPKMTGINRQNDIKITKIAEFQTPHETIYEIEYDSLRGNSIHQYYFDLEILDSAGQNYINSDGLLVGNGNTQSSEFSKSGKYSSKLTKQAPYGMTCLLSEVHSGEHYKISVWRYANDSSGGLVVASNEEGLSYNMVNQPVAKEKQWQKLEFDFIVPETLNNKDLKIYCINNEETPAYFDDLTIEKLE